MRRTARQPFCAWCVAGWYSTRTPSTPGATGSRMDQVRHKRRLGCYPSSEQRFVTSHDPGAALAPSFPARSGDRRSVGMHFAMTQGYSKNLDGSYSMEYEILPT